MHYRRLCVELSICLFTLFVVTLLPAVLQAGDVMTWFRRDHGIAPQGMTLPSEFGEGDDRMWRVELPP